MNAIMYKSSHLAERPSICIISLQCNVTTGNILYYVPVCGMAEFLTYPYPLYIMSTFCTD